MTECYSRGASPTQADPQTLYSMAGRLMALVKTTFLGEGIPLPGREVVYMAPIPADCEQVAVLFSGWTPYPLVDTPMSCERFRWLADFSVIVTRCTPAMMKNTKATAPAAEKMWEAAEIASRDAEALLKVLASVDEFSAPQVTVQSPAGGLQTVELNLQIPAGSI